MEKSSRRKRRRNSGSPPHSSHYPHLRFEECIGRGHFSHVYRGLWDRTPVAIKVIERGSERLVNIETKILKKLRGVDHVVQLLDVIRRDETLLVFELLDGLSVDETLERLTLRRMRRMLRAVLIALREAHARGIVHRDVKLGNIVVSDHFRDIKLIDWGCGIFVSDEMSSKAGSRHCRPPEMLLGYRNYGTKCDVWAVGVLILFVLTGGRVPWTGRTSTRTLVKMSTFFGGNAIARIARKLHIRIDEELDDEMSEEPEESLESCFDSDFDDLFDPDLINLMETLLDVDMDTRPTAEQALAHKFFECPD